MILYFSGTGNSMRIARIIAVITGDPVESINTKIKKGDHSCIEADGRLVISVPTYAWRIPRVVEQWIRETEFKGADKVWFVMSCGGEIGNAAKYIKKLCAEKNFGYMGTKQIVMPENFITMFNAPNSSEACDILTRAEPEIIKTAKCIRDGKPFDKPRSNLYDKFMSAVVNGPFYSLYVKADPYRITYGCISCGRCEQVCPLNNITLVNDYPKWGNNCTQCMACITHCPMKVIEYGNKTLGKPRYRCDDKKVKINLDTLDQEDQE